MKKRLFGLVAMMLAAMIVVLAFPVQVKAKESYGLGTWQVDTKLSANIDYHLYAFSYGDVVVYLDGAKIYECRGDEIASPLSLDNADNIYYRGYSDDYRAMVRSYYLENEGYDPSQTTARVIISSYTKISPEQQAIMKYNDAWDKLQREYADETQLPVEPFMTEKAIASVPDIVKNNSVAIANLSTLKTVPGVMSLINKAQKVTAGDKVAIYTEKPMTFSKEGFEAISNQNKTVVYAFKIDGVLYQITIPAGTKVDFGDNTYVGPLWIGAQLGTTVVLE